MAEAHRHPPLHITRDVQKYIDIDLSRIINVTPPTCKYNINIFTICGPVHIIVGKYQAFNDNLVERLRHFLHSQVYCFIFRRVTSRPRGHPRSRSSRPPLFLDLRSGRRSHLAPRWKVVVVGPLSLPRCLAFAVPPLYSANLAKSHQRHLTASSGPARCTHAHAHRHAYTLTHAPSPSPLLKAVDREGGLGVKHPVN